MRAWREFLVDKTKRPDVLRFEADLEAEIILLHQDLEQGSYQHGGYERFVVSDPKRRVIHKAGVRDRLLHHATHRVLYPLADRRFIFDSYSSRLNKGTHAALRRFRSFAWRLSGNRTRPVWVLQADIRKFFHSVDHRALFRELVPYIGGDKRLAKLLRLIIESFQTAPGKGMPLGNLTSQLFSNIYLNPLDQFIKRHLRVKYYLRYADDLTFLSRRRDALERLLPPVSDFLEGKLWLKMHPDKLSLRPWHKGVDLLGFVSYPDRTIMRPATARRMLRRLAAAMPEDFLTRQNDLYARVKFEHL